MDLGNNEFFTLATSGALIQRIGIFQIQNISTDGAFWKTFNFLSISLNPQRLLGLVWALWVSSGSGVRLQFDVNQPASFLTTSDHQAPQIRHMGRRLL